MSELTREEWILAQHIRDEWTKEDKDYPLSGDERIFVKLVAEIERLRAYFELAENKCKLSLMDSIRILTLDLKEKDKRIAELEAEVEYQKERNLNNVTLLSHHEAELETMILAKDKRITEPESATGLVNKYGHLSNSKDVKRIDELEAEVTRLQGQRDAARSACTRIVNLGKIEINKLKETLDYKTQLLKEATEIINQVVFD